MIGEFSGIVGGICELIDDMRFVNNQKMGKNPPSPVNLNEDQK
jgi:hypothetical protein